MTQAERTSSTRDHAGDADSPHATVVIVVPQIGKGQSSHIRTRPKKLANAFAAIGTNVEILPIGALLDPHLYDDFTVLDAIPAAEIGHHPVSLRLEALGILTGGSTRPLHRLEGHIRALSGEFRALYRATDIAAQDSPSLVLFPDFEWLIPEPVAWVVRDRTAVIGFRTGRPSRTRGRRVWLLTDRLRLAPRRWRNAFTILHQSEGWCAPWQAALPHANHGLMTPTAVSYTPPKISREAARQELADLIPASAKKVVLLFGGMEGHKDLEVAIRALPLLPEGYALLLAGDSSGAKSDLARAFQHAEASYPERLARRDEFIPQEEVEALFAASDCVLVSHTARHLGDSGPAMEAVAARRPVVANRGSLTGREVEEFGFGVTFADGDEADLVRAIVEACEPECPESFEKAFTATSAERNIEGVARSILELAGRD